MRDQLEDRLQRARRQRAEYLRQRGRLHNIVLDSDDSLFGGFNRLNHEAEYFSSEDHHMPYFMEEYVSLSLERKVGEVGGCVKVGNNIQLTAHDGKKQHSHQAEILEQEQMGVTNALIKWYIIVC
ncbi:hypothetical protein CsatB_017341 [Cannabis sativa]